jgi:osomolarity two-component system response regulator SKN7
VSSEVKTEHFLNYVDLEKQKQCHISVEATGAIPFQIEIGTLSARAPS